jgi:D-threo-aldose 1-dehydrogenase
MTLGFGCVNLGSASGGRSTGDDVRLVQEAVELGLRTFDTADAYGSGASERILGRALAARRDEVFLATKGGYVFRERTATAQAARRLAGAARARLRGAHPAAGGGGGGGGSYQQRDLTPSHLRAAVEGSLRRLRTDRVDLYQLHGPQHVDPDLFGELADMRESGKVLAFGIGAESVEAAVDWLAVPAVEVVQIPFGVLDPEAADVLFPRLAERPVEVWARGVLGGGLLARAERDPASVADDPKAPVLSGLAALAAQKGVAVDALAVAFVRSFGAVSTILTGISTADHLRRNVALVTDPPPPVEVVDEVVALARSTAEARRGRP